MDSFFKQRPLKHENAKKINALVILRLSNSLHFKEYISFNLIRKYLFQFSV